MIYEIMQMITKERPVGTNENTIINNYLEQQFSDMGFKVESLPFECTVWEKDKSYLMLGEKMFEVATSPFSEAFDGKGELITVQSTDDL